MNYQYTGQPQIIYADRSNTDPLELKDWIIILLILKIPCLRLIMILVWAFDSGNVNRKRYCQASLIMMIVGFVFKSILWVFLLFAGVLSDTIFLYLFLL